MLDTLDGAETGKRNGLSIHEPSLCRSTFDVWQKRPGNGLYEILLGRHDQVTVRILSGSSTIRKIRQSLHMEAAL